MAIDDSKNYGLTGAQIKDLAAKVKDAGGIKVLTADDYNYPEDNPDGIALWTLDNDIYTWDKDIKTYIYSNHQLQFSSIAIVSTDKHQTNHKLIVTFGSIVSSTDGPAEMWWNCVNETTGALQQRKTPLQTKNNLTTTGNGYALDAKQGKVLKDMIGNLTDLDTTDKSNLVAAINEVAGGGGGGGEFKVLTTADYNWPTTGTKNGVALWLLDSGIYKAARDVNFYFEKDSATSSGDEKVAIVSLDNNQSCGILLIKSSSKGIYTSVNVPSGTLRASGTFPTTLINSLTSTSTADALTAAQGKVLNERIGDLSTLTTTAKTSAVAAINEVVANAGGVKVLTSADYNWNYLTHSTDNPNCIALWLLDPNVYIVDRTEGNVVLWTDYDDLVSSGDDVGTIIISKRNSTRKSIVLIKQNVASSTASLRNYVVEQSGILVNNQFDAIYTAENSLTSTSTSKPLSANQGKVLKDMIDALPIEELILPETVRTQISTTSTPQEITEAFGGAENVAKFIDCCKNGKSFKLMTQSEAMTALSLFTNNFGVDVCGFTVQEPFYNLQSLSVSFIQTCTLLFSYSGNTLTSLLKNDENKLLFTKNLKQEQGSSIDTAMSQGAITSVTGYLEDLDTTDKTSLVNAINELSSRLSTLEGNA